MKTDLYICAKIYLGIMRVKYVDKCKLLKIAIHSGPSLVRFQYFLDSVFHFCLQSESYVMTDGQPASLSWNKAPI
jgi:hypothetical protein